MSDKKVVFLGEKETFIIRVLMKKVQDKGADCVFIPCTINNINQALSETSVMVICMGDEIRPSEEVLHFLSEKLDELDLKLIPLGEQEDVEYVNAHIPGKLIYKTFVRPVDNEAFAQTVSDLSTMSAAGEFKKSIMIVDDDPGYLKLVREWLKDNYKVTMANSGLQAIKLLGNNKVDLILLDHEMPVTSGPQVLEMLRSDPETQSIPVIFLTGKGDKESVMQVVALKPEGYFLKTIQKAELIEKLQEYFILHR